VTREKTACGKHESSGAGGGAAAEEAAAAGEMTCEAWRRMQTDALETPLRHVTYLALFGLEVVVDLAGLFGGLGYIESLLLASGGIRRAVGVHVVCRVRYMAWRWTRVRVGMEEARGAKTSQQAKSFREQSRARYASLEKRLREMGGR